MPTWDSYMQRRQGLQAYVDHCTMLWLRRRKQICDISAGDAGLTLTQHGIIHPKHRQAGWPSRPVVSSYHSAVVISLIVVVLDTEHLETSEPDWLDWTPLTWLQFPVWLQSPKSRFDTVTHCSKAMAMLLHQPINNSQATLARLVLLRIARDSGLPNYASTAFLSLSAPSSRAH